MGKWFEDKLERKNLRKYTKKRMQGESKIVGISRKFSVTAWMIILNIVMYFVIIFSLVSFDEGKVMGIFALQANSFFQGNYWALLTSMFSQNYLTHLFFNLISLFFIGGFLERIIGRKKFFWFYILSGIFAGLFYAILSYNFGITELGSKIFVSPDTYAVGASGAIFGIAGLLAILTPMMRVFLIAGPIFALILQAIVRSVVNSPPLNSIISLMVTFYIFLSIFSIFSFNPRLRKLALPLGMPFWILPIIAIDPLVIIGLFVPLPIGNTAHLGGLIVGLTYGAYLRKKYKRKTTAIRNYFK